VITERTFLPDPPPEKRSPPPDIRRTWRTADGFLVMMIVEDRQFHAICRALDREQLIEDPRCANLLTRIMNAQSLFAQLETELLRWKTADLVDFLSDVQVAANQTVIEIEDEPPPRGPHRALTEAHTRTSPQNAAYSSNAHGVCAEGALGVHGRTVGTYLHALACPCRAPRRRSASLLTLGL
jgi:crotonobetainyl-CoA:carnitine CoA-transferase CaiB-like acyl-CoA transferase